VKRRIGVQETAAVPCSWDDPRVLLALAFIFLGAVSLGIYVGLPQTSPEPALSWMAHSAEDRIPGMASPTEINGLRSAPPEQADTRFCAS
jgi:hypothetical protein